MEFFPWRDDLPTQLWDFAGVVLLTVTFGGKGGPNNIIRLPGGSWVWRGHGKKLHHMPWLVIIAALRLCRRYPKPLLKEIRR